MYNLKPSMLPLAEETDKGGGAGDPPTNEPEKDPWETVLAGMTPEQRKLFEEHTTGLKSALDKERDKSKGVADKLKKLADLEEADRKRAEKDLSEAQKAQAKLADMERELADRDEKLATTRIRSAVELEASKQNYQSPEDAYQMADLSEVKIDDDGKVQGVDAALKALAKAKPYLLKTGNPQKGAPEIDSGRRSTTGQPAEELIAKKRRDYQPL